MQSDRTASRLIDAKIAEPGDWRRAIDFREDETIDGKALKTLVRAAASLDMSKARR